MAKRVKILGARGQWVAEVEGRELAVLHHTQRIGTHGHFMPFDRGDPRGQVKFKRFLAALEREKLVVVQRDVSRDDISRDGYVGVFGFIDLSVDYDGEIPGLSLKYTHRYADPI